MKARSTLAAALLAFSVGAVQALPLAAVLPSATPDEAARLIAGQSILLDAKTAAGLRLVPAGTEGDRIRREAAARPSAFLIESVYLAKGANLSGDARLAAYNALGELRSLSGVTYFSETRQKTTVLFSDVHRVPRPGSREALPDAAAAVLPAASKVELHLKDANFGSTWYSLAIDAGGQGLFLSLTNAKPLGLYLVQAFAAEGFRLSFALVPADEGILVYGICAADPSRAAASLVDLFSAVEKRLNAVRGWVSGRIGGLR